MQAHSLAPAWMTLLLLAGCSRPGATVGPEPQTAAPPAPLAPQAPQAPPAAAQITAAAIAAEVVAAVNAGDVTALHARFSPALKQLAPLADLRAMFAAMLAERGPIGGSTAIAASEREGSFRLDAGRGAWKLQLAVDAEGVVTYLQISEPDAEAPPLARSAPAGLPFRGEWMVVWGGDRREHNHHIDAPSQRRAADLVVVDAAGKTHRGDGRALADYYAYGQDVLAMADGVVVTAIDGVPDNVPGELSPMFLTGNLVVLRHDGDLHSAYAHLVPGSLKVEPGDRVRRGQVLGACGNSGNSSEPHLHVQFQDGPRFDRSWGVEAVFADVVVARDGASAQRTDYTFLQGDRVSPRATERSPGARR